MKFFPNDEFGTGELGTISVAQAFKCEQCGKVLREKAFMHCHMKCHTNNYVCEVDGCGKSFAYKKNLVMHLKTVHLGMSWDEITDNARRRERVCRKKEIKRAKILKMEAKRPDKA